MNARINGKEVMLEDRTRLLDYLEKLGVNPRAVAVEIDGRILARDEYVGAWIEDGSVVEIVRMVGGGVSPSTG